MKPRSKVNFRRIKYLARHKKDYKPSNNSEPREFRGMIFADYQDSLLRLKEDQNQSYDNKEKYSYMNTCLFPMIQNNFNSEGNRVMIEQIQEYQRQQKDLKQFNEREGNKVIYIIILGVKGVYKKL